MVLVFTYDCRWRHKRFSHDVTARGGIPLYCDIILVPYSADSKRRLLPDLRPSKRYLNTILKETIHIYYLIKQYLKLFHGDDMLTQLKAHCCQRGWLVIFLLSGISGWPKLDIIAMEQFPVWWRIRRGLLNPVARVSAKLFSNWGWSYPTCMPYWVKS